MGFAIVNKGFRISSWAFAVDGYSIAFVLACSKLIHVPVDKNSLEA